jgi:hypothetical protein
VLLWKGKQQQSLDLGSSVLLRIQGINCVVIREAPSCPATCAIGMMSFGCVDLRAHFV